MTEQELKNKILQIAQKQVEGNIYTTSLSGTQIDKIMELIQAYALFQFNPEIEIIVLKKDLSAMKEESKVLKKLLDQKEATYKKLITYLRKVVNEFE